MPRSRLGQSKQHGRFAAGQTVEERLVADERALKIIEMRARGMSQAAIGKELGIDRSRVSRHLSQVADKAEGAVVERKLAFIEQHFSTVVATVDALIESLEDTALSDSPDAIDAANALVRYLDMKARLYGLYAPIKKAIQETTDSHISVSITMDDTPSPPRPMLTEQAPS